MRRFFSDSPHVDPARYRTQLTWWRMFSIKKILFSALIQRGPAAVA
jgi:hypothetical protein